MADAPSVRRHPIRVAHRLRTGCAWAHLPHEFPPQGTVHRWFLRLSRSNAFEAMMRVLTALDRACAGRDPLPTAAVMDAQAARFDTVGVAGQRGYDPARSAQWRSHCRGRRRAQAQRHGGHRRTVAGGLRRACLPARQPWRHRAAPGVPQRVADAATLLRRQRLCRAACRHRHGRRRRGRQRRTRAERLRRPAPAMGRRSAPSPTPGDAADWRAITKQPPMQHSASLSSPALCCSSAEWHGSYEAGSNFLPHLPSLIRALLQPVLAILLMPTAGDQGSTSFCRTCR